MAGDPISESAKAAQEIAKATGQGIAAVNSLGGWLDRIFGEAIGEAVRLHWTTKVRERSIASAIFSWERLELLLHKTEHRLRKRGVTRFRFVPPKIVLPLLQSATMEDEDDLHSLWAALLATSLDADGAEVRRKFVTILSDLTSADAAVLNLMWRDWIILDKKEERQSATVTYGPGIEGTEAHDEASVITLNRLGLISPNYTQIRTFLPPAHDGDWKTEVHEDYVQVYGDLLAVVCTR
jgi:Abortive infection alpha